MRSQSTDDYLKALYKLEEAEEAVSTTALAKSMNVTAASATGMIQRLAREKLVDYRRYHGVRLSAEGRRIALQVIRNHRIVEMFLAEELNVPWDRVHDEAERWEHVISPEVVERMAARLGNPDRDPHGQPRRRGSGRRRLGAAPVRRGTGAFPRFPGRDRGTQALRRPAAGPHR
jgi:DtxR family Mn-dependent transcriptional regulator